MNTNSAPAAPVAALYTVSSPDALGRSFVRIGSARCRVQLSGGAWDWGFVTSNGLAGSGSRLDRAAAISDAAHYLARALAA